MSIHQSSNSSIPTAARSFTPSASTEDPLFPERLGEEASTSKPAKTHPETIVVKDAQVGSAAQTVKLK